MKTNNEDATSRRGFLGLGASLAVGGLFVGSPVKAEDGVKAVMTDVSKDTVSNIMTIPPGTTTGWMTHPVEGYFYELEGTLTVEFADGPCMEFEAGQGFHQARSKWHRGRNSAPVASRW